MSVALSLSTLGPPVRRYIEHMCDFPFCPQLVLLCGDELNMCDSLGPRLVLRCGDVLNIYIYVTFPLFTVGPPVRRYIEYICVYFFSFIFSIGRCGSPAP